MLAPVVPLYHYLANGSVPPGDSLELRAFKATVDRYGDFATDSAFVAAWAQSPVVKVFTPDVDSVFAETAYVSRSLGAILAQADEHGLALPQRRYATVVSGRPEAILFVDSTMLISLNHYLGTDYPGYSHIPAYMRTGKTPEALPLDLAEALVATSYPYTMESDDATALSRMVYEGALAYAKKKLVAGATEEQVLGYDHEQMKLVAQNEYNVWSSLVGGDILYDTSAATVSRLVSPSPEVNIVRPAMPGRVGRYVGLRIVEAYLKSHPDAELTYLLSPAFYGDANVLAKAQYRGNK